MKSILESHLRVTMPDATRWDIPVSVIARNRAAVYAHEFDGDAERSLLEDTLPLFISSPYDIEDWAANNMDWEDVRQWAKYVNPQVKDAVDYQEGWINGKKEIVE